MGESRESSGFWISSHILSPSKFSLSLQPGSQYGIPDWGKIQARLGAEGMLDYCGLFGQIVDLVTSMRLCWTFLKQWTLTEWTLLTLPAVPTFPILPTLPAVHPVLTVQNLPIAWSLHAVPTVSTLFQVFRLFSPAFPTLRTVPILPSWKQTA